MLSSDELARDVPGAEEMMNRHAEVKVEIDAKDEKYVYAAWVYTTGHFSCLDKFVESEEGVGNMGKGEMAREREGGKR